MARKHDSPGVPESMPSALKAIRALCRMAQGHRSEEDSAAVESFLQETTPILDGEEPNAD